MQQSHSSESSENEALSIFKNGGEMGRLMRDFDWANHPLGKPDSWPQSLKTNIRLILNSGFPMFIWWTKDLYMFNNDAYIPALGKKHPESLGAKASEMWAEIWDQIGGITEDILRHGTPFYAEGMLMFLERKGFPEETYWTFSYSPAFNDEGEVYGIFCACTEVTSTILGQRRLKTLKEISDAMARVVTLEQAAQTACDALSENSSDLPFSLIYLCNAAESEARLIGLGDGIPTSLAPDVINLNQSDAVWPLAQAKETRQSIVIDLPNLQDSNAADLSGERHLKQAVILPIIRPGHDQVLGFFVAGISPSLEYNEDYQGFHRLLAGHIATSITSVQHKQEILRQQESLKEIFQQAPVGITMLRGPKYIVEIANPGICEIWGRKQEEVLGKPVLESLPEVKEQGIKELLDGVMSTGEPFVANELPLMLQRNGQLEEVYLNFVYHPLRDIRGSISGIIAVAIDISEQVKARHKIEAINKELLATNADLDNFVYSASHDLKAPIYNIEGLVYELQEYLPEAPSDDVQKLVTHIHNSINRFKKVVADLTQVAKTQRGADEDIISIDLQEVIAEAIMDFEPTIAAMGAQIETNLAPGSSIHFSAKNIRSVIYNLLSNALKYSSPDRKPHITITTEHTPAQLILTVTDNGLGLSPADIDKMFTMFKRLHDHVEGSGIGLYIVKRIIENAGGKIEVDSTLNKGTTFRIYLGR